MDVKNLETFVMVNELKSFTLAAQRLGYTQSTVSFQIKQLEKEFFTIDENIKYEMQKEGYRLEDLEKAEKLSVQTGKKAMELIRAKGKASDKRKWSDVVKKEELQAAEKTEVPK